MQVPITQQREVYEYSSLYGDDGKPVYIWRLMHRQHLTIAIDDYSEGIQGHQPVRQMGFSIERTSHKIPDINSRKTIPRETNS